MRRRCLWLAAAAALAAADQLPADHHCAGIVPDVQGDYELGEQSRLPPESRSSRGRLLRVTCGRGGAA